MAEEVGVAPHAVILDVPEPIGFEADIPVREAENERQRFPDSSVFDSGVVAAFSTKLRRIRLLVPPDGVDRSVAAAAFDAALRTSGDRER